MGLITKIENAYKFLSENDEFTFLQLKEASGWTYKTTEKNLWKIGDIVEKNGNKYTVMPDFKKRISLDKFKEAFSQTKLNKSAKKAYMIFIDKSKNAVLSAVQNYNNPVARFRTENFIVLMTIGYTALFHAIFEKYGWNYKDGKTGLFYSLEKCFGLYRSNQEVVKKYDKNFLNALERLLIYFKDIRDLVEHYISDIDDYTYGHFQSWLFCYERILRTEFCEELSINTMLATAIQFSNAFITVRKNLELENFHREFYKLIPKEIQENPFFKLKVRILPYKNINDADFSQNAIFINDPALVEKYAEMDKAIFVAEPMDMAPSDMVERVKPFILEKYGQITFSTSHLSKIAVHMGWVKNGKIVNKVFMKNIFVGKKSSVRRYKEGAEIEIQKEMNKNPKKFLKSFAPKSVYEAWNNKCLGK